MNVKEAVKKKENYSRIVTCFQNLKKLDTGRLVLLIDVIDDMSEEIFEHYKALQMMFRGGISDIIEKRRREGSFSFLTEPEQAELSYALEKAGRMGVLLWEKYEAFYRELEKL